MRKFFALLALVAVSAFAEPSFQQVEGLIEQKNFQSAEMALEQIIAAHPNSAKAFYAMAQAQAGLGHLEKAQYALNKAKALDPELKFASSSNIESLSQAITPQVAKIEVVHESHYWRDFVLVAMFAGFAVACYFMYSVYARKRDEEEAERERREAEMQRRMAELDAKVRAANAQPINKTASTTPTATTYAAPTYSSPAPAPSAPVSAQTTVVNNHYGSNNDGFVTGMLVGNMLSSSHHDHTTIIERDVYVPTPAPSYTPAPTQSVRDSSWDDDSSSKSSSRSSSWDSDDSSSKSSSSWSSSSSSDSSWSSSSSSDSSWSSSDSGSSSSDW